MATGTLFEGQKSVATPVPLLFPLSCLTLLPSIQSRSLSASPSRYPVRTLESAKPITQLIRRFNEGDESVWQELVPHVYDDLRRLAHARLQHERSDHTLSTTALVNECYLRLIQNRQLAAEDRSDFIALASQTMRRLLVDYARARKRIKRGSGVTPVPLEEVEAWLSAAEADEVLSLDDALERLKTLDPRAVRVVELRYFAGLSLDETAAVLNVSSKTVQRVWVAARAWLRKEMGPESALSASGGE
ncbi:MAG: sigma-70 family RNA polymerase sigma factor [Bryobacterales bacterium]|nr:sigma-70 family RNA polymerase sigma factor [Bryobacterales bacterium]